MRTLLHIIRKEFIQLKRDPRLIAILFISPVIQLILLGYAANLDVRDIPAVICDLDGSAAGRALTARFENSGYFRTEATVANPEDVDEYLDRGKASIALIIPKGFGRKVVSEETAAVQVIVDGTESLSATIGLNYAAMIVTEYSLDALVRSLERKAAGMRTAASVRPEIRVWYNPELRSRNFFVPGVLATLLMVMTMMLTSLGIVKEKETGTMEQLVVTPVRPIQLILGKFLPFLLIGLVDVILVITVAVFWFRVPVKGSIILLLGLSIIFMMTTLGLGLFISTISKNQQQAMMTSVFFMIPQIILSGFVFPIENMPEIIRWLTIVIPMKYFLVIIRGIFLKEAGMETLWDEAAALFIFGLAILGLSILRFRKKVG